MRFKCIAKPQKLGMLTLIAFRNNVCIKTPFNTCHKISNNKSILQFIIYAAISYAIAIGCKLASWPGTTVSRSEHGAVIRSLATHTNLGLDIMKNDIKKPTEHLMMS